MSAPAVGAPPLARAARATEPRESLALRLLAFALLCWVAAAEWAGFVTDPPGGRVLGVVAVATVAGAALALAARAPLPRRLRPLAYATLVLAAFVAALLVAGLSTQLLAPARWDTLGAGLDRGLAGTSTTNWPYDGSDPWVRLTMMLAIPAIVVPAMALAFWPTRRGVARVGGLVLLLALFAIPATERGADAPIGRGLLLLALIAAWLWLPRLRGRQVAPAVAALVASALLALPVASALEQGHEPWVDYSSWGLFANQRDGQQFEWDHSYDPLDWPRKGATMLEIASPKSHYWKAETLDHFDGLRWSHSSAGDTADPTAELPAGRNTDWDEEIRFTVRGLQTDLLVTAGTPYAVNGSNLLAGSADGTVHVIDGPLEEGDEYSIETYVPDPSARQMRAAPRSFDTQFLYYTYFNLPEVRGSRVILPTSSGGSVTERTITAPVPGQEPGRGAGVREAIADSPYARSYRLARSLAAGQPTTYDVVKRVERHFQQGFTYDERPPERRIPLDAFLFRDRVGYCQQFSGAMALLLRMNGIPARVAAGFAPGTRDRRTKEFTVRDLDAHSWVEVWFHGIGWVPFDPTPSSSPANAQAAGDQLPSAARGGLDSGGDVGARQRIEPADLGSGGESGGSARWAFVLAAVGLPLGAAAVLWAVAVVRARRVRRSGGDPDVRELRFALERLGHRVPPGATLLDLERRLAVTAGAGAVRYVRALRERRFAAAARAATVRLDRRALRRALGAGRGPIVRVRALFVLPPRRHGGTAGHRS